jgi:hypothetical protein
MTRDQRPTVDPTALNSTMGSGEVQPTITWLYSRQSVHVACAALSDGCAWVRGHQAEQDQPRRSVALKVIKTSWAMTSLQLLAMTLSRDGRYEEAQNLRTESRALRPLLPKRARPRQKRTER